MEVTSGTGACCAPSARNYRAERSPCTLSPNESVESGRLDRTPQPRARSRRPAPRGSCADRRTASAPRQGLLELERELQELLVVLSCCCDLDAEGQAVVALEQRQADGWLPGPVEDLGVGDHRCDPRAGAER